MNRALLAFIILVAVAAALGYRRYTQQAEFRERQEKQIAELNQQVSKLQAENERLKADLAKVQEEENRLVAANETLRKAFEQFKLTGKVSHMPAYPPK